MSRNDNLRHQKQGGNILIVVIFVIVVMGFLAESLTRVNWTNSDNLTREQLGTQAWLLAHSANEWALTTMYPLGESSVVSSACSNIDNGDIAPSIHANVPCQAVSMSCKNVGTLDGQAFYKLESNAICGSGIVEVKRVQEVWVRE